ncbi:MAG: menaquinone biosynthesis protein [Ferruginibacter sp.]
MDRKIRVGAVDYLNTKPLVYGIQQGMMNDRVELYFDYPSNIASALLTNKIDVGLVPIAILPQLHQYQFVSDYCISADGEVASVGLFSEVPVREIEVVLLDYQSSTSIELAQLLLKEYWKINPVFKKADIDFREKISGSTAAVVIGDRAFEQRNISAYSYDLGVAWKELTGLPFVFAAWVSNTPLDQSFIANFNAANEFGLKHIDDVVRQNPCDLFDLKQYYTKYIRYRLTNENRKGMEEFLKRLGQRSGEEIPFFK